MLDRYLARQTLGPVLVALVSVNLLFVVIQLLKMGELAFGAGLGLADLLRVTLLFVPGFAVLTIPVAVLTGVLLGLGRMAEDRELVALAAAGLSPVRLARVPVAIGLVAALMCVCLTVSIAPRAARDLHAAFVDLAKRHVVASLKPGRFFEELPRVVLYPRAAETAGGFDGFLVHDYRPGKPRHTLVASRARVIPVAGGNGLQLDLEDGQVHARQRGGLYSVASFESARVVLDIDRLVQDRTRLMPPAAGMSLGELAAAAGGPTELCRLRVAWHKRFAFPVACLVFGLLGAALGASGRLRGRRRTLLAAVVAVAGFYLLTRLGDVAADHGWLPPAGAAWAPDVLTLGLSALLLARARRVLR
ncbi:MAG: LptF/LptG family permease [Deltaproteobacteria bacterium]|nr:LptF/LptG family permease [Deltaproteobacteria bacterium]